VLRTAQQKCLDVYQTLLANSLKSIPDPTMVIAADTVVVTTSGRILEKPRSEAEHLAMLRMLRDQVNHKVYTAVCVLVPRDDARAPGYNMESSVEETKVVFDETASDEFISAYVKTREAVGMAGGYGIQGMGGLLVERIEGAYDNVVGLPLRVTVGLMEKTLFMQGSNDEDEDEEE
jgi:MAF protein